MHKARKQHRAMLDLKVQTGADGGSFVITPTATDMGARLTPETTEAMRKALSSSLVMAGVLMDILERKGGDPRVLAASALEAAGARLTKKRG